MRAIYFEKFRPRCCSSVWLVATLWYCSCAPAARFLAAVLKRTRRYKFEDDSSPHCFICAFCTSRELRRGRGGYRAPGTLRSLSFYCSSAHRSPFSDNARFYFFYFPPSCDERTTATQTFFYNCKILQLSSAAKLRFCLELNLPFSFSDAQFSKTL